MKSKFKISFFHKLLTISCIIGIIPILLLGYLSYNKSSSALINELTASNKLILQQNKARVEALLKTVDTLTTQTINTPVTTNAMSMQSVLDLPYEYQYREIFEKLIYSLIQIQVYELGIKDVKLASYQENWLVDNGAIYPMKNRVRIDKHDDLLIQTYQDLLAAGSNSKPSYWKFSQNNVGEYELELIKHIPLNSLRPYGLISVHIPLYELNKHLSGDKNREYTFITTSEGTIISSLERENIGSNITNELYFQEIINSNQLEGYFIETVEQKKQLIQYNKALYNQWIYVSITPYEQLTSKTESIKLYTTISASILIFLVIMMSYFFSNKMSSPIIRLYKSISNQVKTTEHNELGYISEHLKELTLSKLQLNNKLEQLHKQAQEFFVIKLLSGHHNIATIDDQLEHLTLPKTWEVWNLVSIQIEQSLHKYSSSDIELLLFAISNIIEETMDRDHIFPPVTNNQMLHIFIGQSLESPVPLKVYVYNNMIKLQENIKKYLKLSVNVGISREHHDWRFTTLATEESIQALYYRERLESATILSIEEAEPSPTDSFRYPREIENQLLEYIKRADKEQAEIHLNELLSHIYSYANHHSDFQHALNRMFNNLTGIIHDNGESINQVLELHRLPAFIFENSKTFDEKKQWLKEQILWPIIDWNQDRIDRAEINISQFIIQKIIDCYDQDLSIEYFAQQLNYHPSYISRVFKKDTGITFTDYLSNYRIEQAKYMLVHTDMKISDIAEKLRYSTASNFNRHFKKVVQLTPSQYREMQN